MDHMDLIRSPDGVEEFESYRAAGVVPWLVVAAVSTFGAFIFMVGMAVADLPPSWGAQDPSEAVKWGSGFVMAVALLIAVAALGLGSSVLKNGP